jgi:hypothetical protein
MPSYLTNMREMFGAGGINDFSTANDLRFHLLNLQMPVYSIVANSHAATAIAWSVTGLLGFCWIVLFVRRTDHQELLQLSALAVIALLPVYHRFMDGIVLMIPLCWCIKAYQAEKQRFAWLMLLLVDPFLLPGASLLATLARSGAISLHVSSSWWWNAVVIPHEAWILPAISLALLYEMSPSHAVESQPIAIAA